MTLIEFFKFLFFIEPLNPWCSLWYSTIVRLGAWLIIFIAAYVAWYLAYRYVWW